MNGATPTRDTGIWRSSETLAPRSGERVARAQRAPGEGQLLATNSTPYTLQLREDHRENAFLISQYVGIPESQHVITVRAERRIASAVPGIILVLPTVNFDDDFLIAANEVYDIGPDGILFRFGIGGLAAKPSL